MNADEKQALIERCKTVSSWREKYGDFANVMLPAVEAQQLAEIALGALTAQPFAWFTDDAETDKSATTYSEQVAERWRSKGWPVAPLYTHHVPAVSLAEIVPDEVTRGNEDVFDVGFANGFNACRAGILRNIEEAG
ncbi:valyl-tRNA synthetase [Pantoea vagans]|uniref:valyl-tRNA synthetase n=1 Tax=Pantoea vagans TaxID=470934 RepID=UPI003B02D03B